jgi:hypothetical protein
MDQTLVSTNVAPQGSYVVILKGETSRVDA